jgi:DNA-directed RNA polymerase
VGLDATTSGLQILSIMGKDLRGAMHSNLAGEGRSDFYTSLNNRITRVSGKKYDRKQTKRAIMTHFYWSVKTPQRVFKADYQLFRSTIKEMVPSVNYAMNKLIEVSKIARNEVTQKVQFPFGRLEYDTKVLKEIDFYHSKLDIRIHHYMYKTKKDPNYKGLVARIVHYIDGWIVSQMINRNDFEIIPIHDCFYTHPNNIDKMRSTYRNIIRDLYDMNLLESICSQFGVKIDPNQLGALEKKHISCEYAIC